MITGYGALRSTMQGSETEDDGGIIRFGEWLEPVVNWCDRHLQSVLDVPRVIIVIIFGLAGYVGGGKRRAAYVAAALGAAALMGDRIWRDSMDTLVALFVVLAAVSALADRDLAARFRGVEPAGAMVAQPSHEIPDRSIRARTVAPSTVS